MKNSQAKTAAGRYYPLTRIGPFVRFVRTTKGEHQWEVGKAILTDNRQGNVQSIVSDIETSRLVPNEDALIALAQWAELPVQYTSPGGKPYTVTLDLLIKWREKDAAERAKWRRGGHAQAGKTLRTSNKNKNKKKATVKPNGKGSEPHTIPTGADAQQSDNKVIADYEAKAQQAPAPKKRKPEAKNAMSELDAMQECYEILSAHDGATRFRMMRWLANALGIAVSV